MPRSLRRGAATHFLLVGLLMAGCDSELDSGDAASPSSDAGIHTNAGDAAVRVDAVDLLFVIDNSGSMASEQTRLSARVEHVARVLTLGDRTPDLPPEADLSNGARYFTPVKSLHVGVVSTNLGGIDEPQGNGQAINSCRGLGDDGQLQRSTELAEHGVTAMSDREFEGYPVGGVVMPGDPTCALGALPTFFDYRAGGALSTEQLGLRLRCVARLGVRGCPFEQPLEAMWKALAPSQAHGELYEFLNGSRGQGDRYNAGFLREDALLAVVLITDEDDCSIKQQGKLLFDQQRGGTAEATFGPKINLRCGQHAEDTSLVHPVARYTEALKSLKPGHPERIIFAAITGIPQAAEGLDLDETLARPDMQFHEQDSTGIPVPSCIRENPTNPQLSERAVPGRRLLQVAKSFGDNAVVHSICAEDYAPALDSVMNRMAAQMPL